MRSFQKSEVRSYTPEQFKLFREKINELFRDNEPDVEPSACRAVGTSLKTPKPKPKPSKAIEKIRKAVYKSTISQTKYTNKNLLATFILVTVAEGTTYLQAREATKFSIHLIIRTRKCINIDDSSNCCMIFIDEMGNVYQNWNHFIKTNCLPEGVALAPSQGVYQFENDNDNSTARLVLDSWVTPASSITKKAAGHADVVAGVGGFAAASGTVAALAFPVVFAPALPVLAVIGTGAGVYSAIRSGCSLLSRNDHEQSIALTNSSARGAWLGVASGALAASSSLATKSLARLALAGKEVSVVREVVVNGMNISTMLLSGTGVANGALDLILKYNDDEKITGLDVLQVAASLAIFTHSVYNFRLASTIVAQSRDSKVNSYRTELSNRQRKMFDKLFKETIRTQGASKGKMDIIRLINEVPDRQYLNDINKINKDLNRNKIRVSAGQNGHIALNDEVQVQSGDLRSSVQHGVGENILGKVSQPIPDSHQTIPNQETLNILTQNAFYENTNTIINYCKTAFQIASPLILNSETLQDCVKNIIEKVGEKIAIFIIEKSNEFIVKYGRTIENFLKTKLHLEDVVWHLYKKCEQSFRTFTIETIQTNIQLIFEQLIAFYEEMSNESSTSQKIKCKICKGFYQICSI
ncbi:uncharacterized protein LOC129945548 isoform X2 [Eupeodes corollae]|uniref:uncharacterized protein LOC129945548 isoform X2 n=1 Tax=Eupeodes corollae TaxID=290404 RepID=UPI002491FEB0|nr:uncharacterized protein LOC129945548 isoform X2 [Eupeodes corollae]